MLAFTNLLAFSGLSRVLGEAAGGIPADLVVALSVLSYLLVVEGWIWFKRIRARNSYHLIENLSEKYEFSPRRAATVAPSTAEPEGGQAKAGAIPESSVLPEEKKADPPPDG